MKNLLNSWFQAIVYVRLMPDKLSVRNVRKNITIEGRPVAAITQDAKHAVLVVGEESYTYAHQPDVKIVNPFSHPRTLLADFTVAEQVLKGFLKKLFAQASLFQPAPTILLHPCIDPEGGFTQIEIRAMRELCYAAGGRNVTIWQGRELTDEELLSGKFPSEGKVLS